MQIAKIPVPKQPKGGWGRSRESSSTENPFQHGAGVLMGDHKVAPLNREKAPRFGSKIIPEKRRVM